MLSCLDEAPGLDSVKVKGGERMLQTQSYNPGQGTSNVDMKNILGFSSPMSAN